MANTAAGRKPSYWIALLPIMLGAATCGGSFVRLSHEIEGMIRVPVPGQHRVKLEAGKYIGFLEARSVIDGRVIASDVRVRCGMAAASGEPVHLAAPGVETSYSFGGYAGKSFLDVDIPATGEYDLSCEGDGAGALAFGSGIGIMIIVIPLVGGLAGLFIAVALAWRIRKRRRVFEAAAMQSGIPPSRGA